LVGIIHTLAFQGTTGVAGCL